MPRGFGGVEAAQQDIEARKNAGGSGGKLFFKLADGEVADVRFLEQGDEVNWAWVHELPPAPNRIVGDKIPCRAYDEEGVFTGENCPGCDRQYKRTFQGAINLIWRNAPVFARDENGRIVKNGNAPVVTDHKDQIAVWVQGITVFNELSEKDSTYRGLSSRDFKIRRRGKGLSTKYSIDPSDPDGGPKALSASDEELAAEKYDLTPFVEPPSYESWGNRNAGQTGSSDVQPAETSPFMRNRS